jgi:hypothetical protein
VDHDQFGQAGSEAFLEPVEVLDVLISGKAAAPVSALLSKASSPTL